MLQHSTGTDDAWEKKGGQRPCGLCPDVFRFPAAGAPHTVESLPGNPAAFFRRDGESAGFFRAIAEELE